jgi:hypothetical protein
MAVRRHRSTRPSHASHRNRIRCQAGVEFLEGRRLLASVIEKVQSATSWSLNAVDVGSGGWGDSHNDAADYAKGSASAVSSFSQSVLGSYATISTNGNASASATFSKPESGSASVSSDLVQSWAGGAPFIVNDNYARSYSDVYIYINSTYDDGQQRILTVDYTASESSGIEIYANTGPPLLSKHSPGHADIPIAINHFTTYTIHIYAIAGPTGRVPGPNGFNQEYHNTADVKFAVRDLSRTNLVALQFRPNTTIGGVDYQYEIEEGVLPFPAKGGLYWSPNATYDPATATPIPATFFLTGTKVDNYPSDGLLHISASKLDKPPPGATKLLLVLDPPYAEHPNGDIDEEREDDNVLAIDIPPLAIPTSTSVVASPSPSVYGQEVTFTATVSAKDSSAGIPTGTVEFLAGKNDLGNALLRDGIATFKTKSIPVGSYAITARYVPTGSFAASQGPTSHTVSPADTTVQADWSVEPAAKAAVYGQSVHLTARVAAVAADVGTPSGLVEFWEGNTRLATAGLGVDGVATADVGGFDPGNHVVEARYFPDTNDFRPQSGPTTVPVDRANTQVTLTSSVPAAPSFAYYGLVITYTAAAVAVAPGAGVPQGPISIVDTTTGQVLGAINPQAGVTSVTVNTLTVGTHSIIAIYQGDGFFNPNSSDPFAQKIERCPTFIQGVFQKQAVFGQDIEFDVFVVPFIPPPQGVVPTGAVGVLFQQNVIVSGPLHLPFLTKLTFKLPSAGTHTVTVAYDPDGDPNYAPTMEPVQVEVSKAPLQIVGKGILTDRASGIPAPTVEIRGLVNGDQPSVLQGTPKITIPPAAYSSAGRYPITVDTSGMSADNYEIQPVNGELVVRPSVMDVRVEYGKRSISLLNLNRDLPFTNIRAIDVIFSDDVVVDQVDLSLASAQTPGLKYASNGFTYAPTTRTARWMFPTDLVADRLTLAIDGDDASNDRHDGVRFAPDIYLGNYALGFSVLPGDYNGDRVVNSLDLVGINLQRAGIADPALAVWADLDGNGVEDVNDVLIAQKKSGTRLS